MNLLLQAAHFAAEKHQEQRRKNPAETPYINHPLEVAAHLSSVGHVTDESLLAAAILHDTVEDTDTSPEELCELFGEEITALVMECTDDKSLEKAERKRLQIVNAPKKSAGAKQIKLADKTCNLRSILVDPPEGWSAERQREYFRWANQVIDGLLGVNEPLETEVKRVLHEGYAKLGA
ncbi:MAG: HD domain-containing protein [Verrucomicrobiota bacterium]